MTNTEKELIYQLSRRMFEEYMKKFKSTIYEIKKFRYKLFEKGDAAMLELELECSGFVKQTTYILLSNKDAFPSLKKDTWYDVEGYTKEEKK